jgi:hypothetical protein
MGTNREDIGFGCLFAVMVIVAIAWFSILVWLAITGIRYLQSEMEENENSVLILDEQ